MVGGNEAVDWSIISDEKELDVRGAHLGPHCWPAAIRMIESGMLPMDEICTHQLPLTDFQKGLDLVADWRELPLHYPPNLSKAPDCGCSSARAGRASQNLTLPA